MCRIWVGPTVPVKVVPPWLPVAHVLAVLRLPVALLYRSVWLYPAVTRVMKKAVSKKRWRECLLRNLGVGLMYKNLWIQRLVKFLYGLCGGIFSMPKLMDICYQW
jgi:hypothetical protein